MLAKKKNMQSLLTTTLNVIFERKNLLKAFMVIQTIMTITLAMCSMIYVSKMCVLLDNSTTQPISATASG